MKKYTLKSIKQTPVYKANIDAVRAIYPAHAEDFARELMIAFNYIYMSNKDTFMSLATNIRHSFLWVVSPQGEAPWRLLCYEIEGYKKKNEDGIMTTQSQLESLKEDCIQACLNNHYHWKWDDKPDSSSGPRDCAKAIEAIDLSKYLETCTNNEQKATLQENVSKESTNSDTMREAFEAAHSRNLMGDDFRAHVFSFSRTPRGYYVDSATQFCWATWRHQQAKIDALESLIFKQSIEIKQAENIQAATKQALGNSINENARLREPISDEQIEFITDICNTEINDTLRNKIRAILSERNKQ